MKTTIKSLNLKFPRYLTRYTEDNKMYHIIIFKKPVATNSIPIDEYSVRRDRSLEAIKSEIIDKIVEFDNLLNNKIYKNEVNL